MMDWNVPDWHGLIDYPCFKGSRAPAAWAWEFLRRNHDYRAFYVEHRNLFELVDDDDGKGVLCEGAIFDSLRAQFGIDVLFPPWSTNLSIQERFLGKPHDLMPMREFVHNESGKEPFFRFMKVRQSVLVKENEVYFYIDLDMPLTPQVARIAKDAKKLLGVHKKKGVWGKLAEIKTYINYLRILDAYDAGAKPKEIGEVLFPNLSNDFPDRDRSNKLRNDLREAKRLRDGGYRVLAAICDK